MGDDASEKLRQAIRAAQTEQNQKPARVLDNLPSHKMSLHATYAKEVILAIIGGGFIGWVLDTIFSTMSMGYGGEPTFPMCTAIVIFFALLAAAYRCRRIKKGLDPDG